MADELGEGDIQFGRLILGVHPTDTWPHSLYLLWGARVGPAHLPTSGHHPQPRGAGSPSLRPGHL